ncbi:unnamed protein product [Trichobilharzia regenti]|nr:unnamed protein product [Trichobilharzia regenti]
MNSVVNHWKDVEPPLQYLIIFVITLGCIILILGAIGLLGACTKSVCLLATLKCCGARSSSDYETTPNSCYDGDKLFKKGCVEKLSELAKKNMNTITICVFLFAFFQTICLLFAICAIVAIRQDD